MIEELFTYLLIYLRRIIIYLFTIEDYLLSAKQLVINELGTKM